MGRNTHNNSGARAKQSRRNNYPETQYEEPQKVKVVRGDVSHTDLGDLLLQLAVLSMIKSDNTSFLKNTSSLLENHHSLSTKISHQPTSNDMTSVVTQNSHVHLNSLTQQSSAKSTKTSSTTTKIVEQVKASNQDKQLSSHPTADDKQSISRVERSVNKIPDISHPQNAQEQDDNYTVEENQLMAFGLDIKAIKQKIQNNPSITKLWIKNAKIETKDAKSLGEMLEGSQINNLSLDGNKLGTKGAIYLVEMLKGTNVNTLELIYNDIRSEEAAKLGKAFKDTKITNLSLKGNKLYTKGAIDFVKAIKENNVNIKVLNLEFNWIGGKIENILPYLKDTNLIEMKLGDNKITNNTLQKILKEIEKNGKNIDNESATTEGGFTITEEDATHTNEEPTPESHTAPEEGMSLGSIIGKFLIVPVVCIIGAAATIAGCVTYINNKFCNDKKVKNNDDINMVDISTVASQGMENGGQVVRKSTVYRKSPQEQPPENIPSTSHNNKIYVLSSAKTMPLPTIPGDQPVRDEIDGLYEL